MKIKAIMETIKTGREVLGTVVINKVDGKDYTITAVDTGAESVTVTEVLPEDAPEGTEPNALTVTEENEKCFSYRYNPNPKPVPEAEVKDGVLMVNGIPVVMGNITPLAVLATVSNEVLFTVAGSMDGRVVVKVYRVDTDRFADITGEVSGSIRAEDMKDMVLLIEERTTLVPQVDDDGEPVLDANGEQVVKTRFDGAFVYQYNGTCIETGCGCDNEDEDDCFDDGVGDGIRIEAPVTKLEVVSYGNEKTLVVTSESVVKDGYLEAPDGNSLVTLLEVKTSKRHDTEYNTLRYTASPLCRKVKGTDPVVTITRDGRLTFVIKTDKMVDIVKGCNDTVIDNAAIATELSGYDCYIGTETEGDTAKVSFADSGYKVKTVCIRHTPDRGDIVSME